MVLWEHDAQPMGVIAERLDLPPNAMTPLIARMEVAGWLRRRHDPVDRRCITVHLTERGRSLERAAFQVQKTVAGHTQLSFERFHCLRKELLELTTVLEQAVSA